MQEKTFQSSGADERTPSRSQYFSWINNTNEGSTEEQTLINLEYFRWLHDTFGMELDIYAWDAGNLDGASGTYENPNESEKLKKQYPNGYAPIAKAAAEFGCRMGVWAGADGFGDSEETQKKRYELMVGLCRDYGFSEFKVDTVCGCLRPEKRGVFKQMIDECRKYVPGLILLNHRNELGDAEICATTFLWGGEETYIDVHIFNNVTGSHHRVQPLIRGLVPDMKRLTEDHGVCLSSCLDYFDDDLIIQGFARCLILAPEIYGNPWFLRDSEQAKLAHIYNLHRRYRDVLVDGIVLPEKYGKNAVSRGSGDTRLLVFANPTWKKETITVPVSEEIGLDGRGEKYVVKMLHPYESLVGIVNGGASAEITVEPFRVALVLVQEYSRFMKEDFVLTGCEYEPIDGADGRTKGVRVFAASGEPIEAVGCRCFNNEGLNGDNRIKAPVFLGTLSPSDLPENARAFYEATCFSADNDSFEAQSLKRSGETDIPCVKAARKAFFEQKTYTSRGCESSWMFDGKHDTFFDGESVYYRTRLDGGCLRVDFGCVNNVGKLEIEYFEINEEIYEVHRPHVAPFGEISVDLREWKKSELIENEEVEACSAPVVRDSVHNIDYVDGHRKKAVFEINGKMRYFALPEPPDRIYSVAVFDKNGEKITVENVHANNMLSSFEKKHFTSSAIGAVHIPESTDTKSYIAVAVNGITGEEGAYCAASCNNKLFGASDRAPSYPVNNWEYICCSVDNNYTYYIPVDVEMLGKDVSLTVLLEDTADVKCEAWLCDTTDKKPLAEIVL